MDFKNLKLIKVKLTERLKDISSLISLISQKSEQRWNISMNCMVVDELTAWYNPLCVCCITMTLYDMNRIFKSRYSPRIYCSSDARNHGIYFLIVELLRMMSLWHTLLIWINSSIAAFVIKVRSAQPSMYM